MVVSLYNFSIDHLDVRISSQAELEARRIVPEIAGFLVNHIPGFEQAVVADSAPMVGVRYTRWIDAGFDLTTKDVAEGAQFDDLIGAQSSHANHPKGGVVYLPPITELPYRIMVPQNVDNLTVASGKSASTSSRGIVRGQVSCYLLGQGAGVAAAVAAKSGSSARDVDIKKVQKELLKQNVYLGDQARLAELGLT